ncbi:MAG: hypothetical protein ACJAZ2_000235 [Glaciecola sp.]
MRRIKLLVIIFIVVFVSNSYGKYNLSAQGSYMHFFGETKLTHFGGGLRAEYVYNEWAVAYAGANYYSKKKYTGIVEAEAIADNTRPFLVDIPVPSSIYFIQGMVGARVYFYGELNPIEKGSFGFYGIGEFSLLIGTSESEVLPGPEYNVYNVPFKGKVKGTFYNYTGSLGSGGEKQVGRAFIYAEAKFNIKLDEANPFSVSTRIPYGMSYFLGVRIPLSNY